MTQEGFTPIPAPKLTYGFATIHTSSDERETTLIFPVFHDLFKVADLSITRLHSDEQYREKSRVSAVGVIFVRSEKLMNTDDMNFRFPADGEQQHELLEKAQAYLQAILEP